MELESHHWVVIITLACKKDQWILKLVGESLMRKLDMVSKYLHTKYFRSFRRKMLTVQFRNTADISFTEGLTVTSDRTK